MARDNNKFINIFKCLTDEYNETIDKIKILEWPLVGVKPEAGCLPLHYLKRKEELLSLYLNLMKEEAIYRGIKFP